MGQEVDAIDPSNGNADALPVKKPYSAPRVEVLGDVKELTAGAGTGVADTPAYSVNQAG